MSDFWRLENVISGEFLFVDFDLSEFDSEMIEFVLFFKKDKLFFLSVETFLVLLYDFFWNFRKLEMNY